MFHSVKPPHVLKAYVVAFEDKQGLAVLAAARSAPEISS